MGNKSEVVTKEVIEALREAFTQLTEPVAIEVYTKIGDNDMFNDFTADLIGAMPKVTGKIKLNFYKIGDEQSRKRNVLRSPTVLIAPDRYNIRYTGAPAGEEGRSIVMAVIMASTGQSILSDDAKKRLNRLKEKRHIRVFVSPT